MYDYVVPTVCPVVGTSGYADSALQAPLFTKSLNVKLSLRSIIVHHAYGQIQHKFFQPETNK